MMKLIAILIVAAAFTGCSMPRYALNLNEVLTTEGRDNPDRYSYRCTRGAHRGASEMHTENTTAALLAANDDDQYAFIEFDVQYSKDGTIVVFHDKRMTRVFGSMRSIGKATFEELTELSHGGIAAYYDVIPLLTKKLNIEIKSQGDDKEDEKLVDAIMADITARKRTDDVFISAISKHVVQYVNEKYPDMRTGQIFWLKSSTFLPFDGLTEKLYEDISETDADYLMLHVANLRNIDDLLTLKPKGKTIVFWDFDDRMYVLHADLSDRIWGDSYLTTFCKYTRYKLASLFGSSVE